MTAGTTGLFSVRTPASCSPLSMTAGQTSTSLSFLPAVPMKCTRKSRQNSSAAPCLCQRETSGIYLKMSLKPLWEETVILTVSKIFTRPSASTWNRRKTAANPLRSKKSSCAAFSMRAVPRRNLSRPSMRHLTRPSAKAEPLWPKMSRTSKSWRSRLPACGSLSSLKWRT